MMFLPLKTPQLRAYEGDEKGVKKNFQLFHAVKMGDDLKISGAVRMDDKGNKIGPALAVNG